MAKQKKKTEKQETDSAFLLKIVMYVILASLWIKLIAPLDFFGIGINGIPLGLFVGLLVTRHERFRIDRKIEYVVLIIVTILTYFIPAGIVV